MNSGQRTIAPSKSRIAAAAKAGRFSHSSLITSGLVVLSFAVSLSFFGFELFTATTVFIKTSLINAVTTRPLLSLSLFAIPKEIIVVFISLIVIPFFVGAIATIIPAIIAKRNGGSTVVAIPTEKSFSVAKGLIASGCIVVFCLLTFQLLKENVSVFYISQTKEPEFLKEVLSLFVSILFVAGISMCLFGLADVMLCKNHLLKDLSVSAEEAKRENRLQQSNRFVLLKLFGHYRFSVNNKIFKETKKQRIK